MLVKKLQLERKTLKKEEPPRLTTPNPNLSMLKR